MGLNVIKIKKAALFTHLILFDFFFIDSVAKENLIHFGSSSITGVNKKIFLLSFFEQFKSFKQFFRLLQYLKKSNSRC